jgi:hypothetical protein
MKYFLRYGFAPILLMSVLALNFVGCTKKNWEDIQASNVPTNDCDTTVAISFSVSVAPLMVTSCGSDKNICHNAKGANGNVVLEDYAGVVDAIAGGKMESSITNGPVPMPKSGYTLDACNLNKILAWIHQGAKNN